MIQFLTSISHILMNNKKYNSFAQAQELLYVWLSRFEKRSLSVISSGCNTLNDTMDLRSPNPMWSIFWPLVFNGVVDHIGNGYYALTDPLILDFESHYCYINCSPKFKAKKTGAIGIVFCEHKEEVNSAKVIAVDATAIMMNYPTVSDIVDGFPNTLQDNDNLVFYNWKTNRGIAKLEQEGLTRYFSMPEKSYIREIPSRTINPDAFSIAYCYSRAINEEGNGIYRTRERQLVLPSFALPIMIYRALLLESLKNKTLPEKSEDSYIFKEIPPSLVKELNRVLCKSVRYE